MKGRQGNRSLPATPSWSPSGRKPYSEKLGLEALGIQKDAKGFVQIDASFRTAQPHIFAIGDLVERADARAQSVRRGDRGSRADRRAPPLGRLSWRSRTSPTHPEVASVGLTEEELKSRGVSCGSASFPFKANSRARCTGEEEGFVKILAEEKQPISCSASTSSGPMRRS